MTRLIALASMLAIAAFPVLPAASAPSCAPQAWPEAIGIQSLAASAEVGNAQLYVVASGSRYLAQSDVELWRESNGAPGLQRYAECGHGPDAFLLGACLARTGNLGALECPEVRTGDVVGSHTINAGSPERAIEALAAENAVGGIPT